MISMYENWRDGRDNVTDKIISEGWIAKNAVPWIFEDGATGQFKVFCLKYKHCFYPSNGTSGQIGTGITLVNLLKYKLLSQCPVRHVQNT